MVLMNAPLAADHPLGMGAGRSNGVAAILWMPQRSSVDPLMGLVPVLKAFIATTPGGLGSLQGAVLGGLLLGAIEIYLAAYLPDAMLPYHGALTLGVVILVLVARPQGLVGARREAAR
jgi:branched-chain amino acid transport system permease protein